KPTLPPKGGKKPGKTPAKPDPDKPKKPKGGVLQPEEGKKPAVRRAPRPARDHRPLTSAIDAEVDRHLASARVPASPRADDAEFLRRVPLDLTGRIPTYARTLAFLRSTDPDKRARLIDELLASPAFARHFAEVWGNRIAPVQDAGGKGQRDTFTPWLAEQLE